MSIKSISLHPQVIKKSTIFNWIRQIIPSCAPKLKIQSLGKGDIYCMILNYYFPGSIALNKIHYNPINQYQCLLNLKLFQKALQINQIVVRFQIHKIVKLKFQENWNMANLVYNVFVLKCYNYSFDLDAQFDDNMQKNSRKRSFSDAFLNVAAINQPKQLQNKQQNELLIKKNNIEKIDKENINLSASPLHMIQSNVQGSIVDQQNMVLFNYQRSQPLPFNAQSHKIKVEEVQTRTYQQENNGFQQDNQIISISAEEVQEKNIIDQIKIILMQDKDQIAKIKSINQLLDFNYSDLQQQTQQTVKIQDQQGKIINQQQLIMPINVIPQQKHLNYYIEKEQIKDRPNQLSYQDNMKSAQTNKITQFCLFKTSQTGIQQRIENPVKITEKNDSINHQKSKTTIESSPIQKLMRELGKGKVSHNTKSNQSKKIKKK